MLLHLHARYTDEGARGERHTKHAPCVQPHSSPPTSKTDWSTNSLTELKGLSWTSVIPKKAHERLQCCCAVAWATVESLRDVWNVALERSQQRDRFCAAATWFLESGKMLGLRSVQSQKGTLVSRAPGNVESGNKTFVLTVWGRSCRSNAASLTTDAVVANAVENRALSIP